jgi:hypothetical protein
VHRQVQREHLERTIQSTKRITYREKNQQEQRVRQQEQLAHQREENQREENQQEESQQEENRPEHLYRSSNKTQTENQQLTCWWRVYNDTTKEPTIKASQELTSRGRILRQTIKRR